MRKETIQIRPLGDRAFTIRWREPIEADALAEKAEAIAGLRLPWLLETVAAFGSITVYMRMSAGPMTDAINELLRLWDTAEPQASRPRREVELPIVYGGENGPDLAECAGRSAMSAKRFAELHAGSVYRVEAMGFAPGFPYLSGLDKRLEQPRRDSPRQLVPAGSVGIAGSRTGVYPVASPGGWQIIGRTAVPLFRPSGSEPFLLAPGDRVRFAAAEELQHPEEKDASAERLYSDDPVLRVVEGGLSTTIQDGGRFGWRSYGVSSGGAMDEWAFRLANLLVGNDENAAALELTLIGGSYRIEQAAILALCGADLTAKLGGEPFPLNRPVYVEAGTTLSFGRPVFGCRAYLAIAGGLDVPSVLGSRSADTRARIGGGCGRRLTAGDAVGVSAPAAHSAALREALKRKASRADAKWSAADWSAADWRRIALRPNGASRNSSKAGELALRLLIGEEWGEFEESAREALLGTPFRVEASSDRMGLRLHGEVLKRSRREELVSHGVAPGTLQIPPNGQPIVLGAGCQPTGGYPKLAHVISADLPLLAQAAPGDWLVFRLVTRQEAEEALRLRHMELARLGAGIRLRMTQASKEGARE
ncbi:5-oxoprolinase subunit PxpB [Cohnella boryungensis]|uniref:5-oxoprolinase subunit PxpB n=1 Tax=Cohnella boryungensis TaxID=768479 RepID=A0ABV8SBL4_9BACL